MDEKYALFHNGVADPYVVNYIWLYGKLEETSKTENGNKSSVPVIPDKKNTNNKFVTNQHKKEVTCFNENEKREDSLF